VGGQGAPIWLAGVMEKGGEELGQIQCDMRGCRAFQNEVDFRASQSRRAVEAIRSFVFTLFIHSFSFSHFLFLRHRIMCWPRP